MTNRHTHTLFMVRYRVGLMRDTMAQPYDWRLMWNQACWELFWETKDKLFERHTIYKAVEMARLGLSKEAEETPPARLTDNIKKKKVLVVGGTERGPPTEKSVTLSAPDWETQ